MKLFLSVLIILLTMSASAMKRKRENETPFANPVIMPKSDANILLDYLKTNLSSELYVLFSNGSDSNFPIKAIVENALKSCDNPDSRDDILETVGDFFRLKDDESRADFQEALSNYEACGKRTDIILAKTARTSFALAQHKSTEKKYADELFKKTTELIKKLQKPLTDEAETLIIEIGYSALDLPNYDLTKLVLEIVDDNILKMTYEQAIKNPKRKLTGFEAFTQMAEDYGQKDEEMTAKENAKNKEFADIATLISQGAYEKAGNELAAMNQYIDVAAACYFQQDNTVNEYFTLATIRDIWEPQHYNDALEDFLKKYLPKGSQ